MRPSRSKSFQRYLIRFDLNVPLQNGKIQDDYKLKAVLPTIRLLRQVPLIIISHLGEPVITGSRFQFQAKYSLKPIAHYLEKKLKRRVTIIKGSWSSLYQQSRKLKPGEILMLENIRFWPGEIKNDRLLAQQLAKLGDIYINDALAVSHRAHASVSAITHFLPAYAGPLLQTEVKHLRTLLERRNLTLILGGAKISTKLPVITNLLPRARYILLGGAMANNVLRARGYAIGNSLYDTKEVRLAKTLKSKKIIIPSDVIVQRGKKYLHIERTQVTTKDTIVDIGLKTAQSYAAYITASRTIMWNGPMGIYEKLPSRRGTTTIIRAIQSATRHGAFSVVGGGETISALNIVTGQKSVGWVSTGGGATLMFLSGKRLPGLQGLIIS